MPIRIFNNKANYDAIVKAMADGINQRIPPSVRKQEPSIRRFVTEAILDQPEIKSILGGELQGEFGIPNGQTDQAVFEIAQTVTNSIDIQWTPVSKDIRSGGLKIYVQPADFAELLALRSGFVHAVHRNDGPYDMHWLDWLLTRGDERIVEGYEYVNDANGGYFSRSGQGIMRKGGSWGVPTEFAGDESDNFITRALTDDLTLQQIEQVLKLILIG